VSLTSPVSITIPTQMAGSVTLNLVTIVKLDHGIRDRNPRFKCIATFERLLNPEWKETRLSTPAAGVKAAAGDKHLRDS
jgi:hypothetical protein